MNSQSVLLGRKPPMANTHGGGVRGAVLSRRSPQFEGRFGRIFRALPPADFDPAMLEALAREGNMAAEPEAVGEGDDARPAAALEDEASSFHDAEENTGIPAGYTYLGQFIDHDLTFDPASSLQKTNDPDGLVNFRTPRFDLDSLYGRGPDDQPYMYTEDGMRFLLGRVLTEGDRPSPSRDLPRHHWTERGKRQDDAGDDAHARALIGDKRNDENVIVSQLHGAMLQFHNRIVDEYGYSFQETQRLVRWHYQWVVLHDFLPRIVGRDMVRSILPHLAKPGANIYDEKPKLRFYHPKESSFIPIEFAAAAYRFGHSMVRPIYRLNQVLDGGEDPLTATDEERARGLAGRFFIFAGVPNRGLDGFREFPSQWAIDWSLYFDIDGSSARSGKARVQPAYKIDTSLVNPLAFLPEFSQRTQPPLTLKSLRPNSKPDAVQNLAERNLKRGLFMSLPSGQDVARAMAEVPLSDDQLLVGKATYEDAFGEGGDASNRRLVDIHKDFAGRAPLWFYVLAEALWGWMQAVERSGESHDAADRIPTRLGPVGGRIVAETLIGILLGDSHSFLSQDPNWRPTVVQDGARFEMGDLIKYALGPKQ